MEEASQKTVRGVVRIPRSTASLWHCGWP